MRRALIAATVSGLLFATAACSADNRPTTTPSAGPGGASAAAPRGSAPAGTAPAGTAPAAAAGGQADDTQRVCGEYLTTVGTGMAAFGNELGKLVERQSANKPELVKESQDAVKRELEKFAESLQGVTGKAQDRGLVMAGQQAAKNIRDSAGDAEFYKRMSNIDTFEKEFQGQFAAWTAPITAVCR